MCYLVNYFATTLQSLRNYTVVAHYVTDRDGLTERLSLSIWSQPCLQMRHTTIKVLTYLRTTLRVT